MGLRGLFTVGKENACHRKAEIAKTKVRKITA